VKASLRLRRGEVTVVEEYEERGRLHGGTERRIRRAAVRAWWEATERGESACLTAPTNAAVVALNNEAQWRRLDAGQLDADGKTLTVPRRVSRHGRCATSAGSGSRCSRGHTMEPWRLGRDVTGVDPVRRVTRSSSRWQSRSQVGVERSSLLDVERPGNRHALTKSLAPCDEHAADIEWLREQSELSIDEAQGAVYGDVRHG
jgi:hypothetical protein